MLFLYVFSSSTCRPFPFDLSSPPHFASSFYPISILTLAFTFLLLPIFLILISFTYKFDPLFPKRNLQQLLFASGLICASLAAPQQSYNYNPYLSQPTTTPAPILHPPAQVHYVNIGQELNGDYKVKINFFLITFN